MLNLWQLAIGLLCSAAIGALGYRRGSLSRGGWLGAVLVGTATFGVGGWGWGLLVILFFALSTALSHYQEARKQALAGEKFAKGTSRDLAQALANGGAAAALALLSAVVQGPLPFIAAVGALATAAADTWATEVGVLSKRAPRLVTTGRSVEPGTSGAISGPGTLAAAAGGLTLGLGATLVAALGAVPDLAPTLLLIPIGLAAGLAGALFDSLLGATIQGIRRCPRCERETERAVHRCGTPTVPARGWQFLDNDLVNFVSTCAGSATAVFLALIG